MSSDNIQAPFAFCGGVYSFFVTHKHFNKIVLYFFIQDPSVYIIHYKKIVKEVTGEECLAGNRHTEVDEKALEKS
jgi:hypothetical protein